MTKCFTTLEVERYKLDTLMWWDKDYKNTDSLVVIDDKSNSKKFRKFRNIESVYPVVDKFLPIEGEILINGATETLKIEPENASYNMEWDWDINPDGPPKDKEEIFADFFGELFYLPNERILTKYMLPSVKSQTNTFLFAKKKFLDIKKNIIFKKPKYLYFYKLGHDFLRIKNEKFSLPSSINTENVEILYFSDGQIIDFKTITPERFPNLKKLIIETKINLLNKFPKFNKLEEIYFNRNKYKNTLLDNLKNLKHLIFDIDDLNNEQLKILYFKFGKKFKVYGTNIEKVLKKRKISI